MSRHVPDDRLDIIHAQLSHAFRRAPGAWVYDAKGHAICNAHDIIAALDELRMRRQTVSRTGGTGSRAGHTAQVLAAMKVGEIVEIEPITKGAMTNSRRTARILLGIPDAVWWTRTQRNGLVQVERAPDGSPPHAKYHNPAVYVLANMEVGQTVTLTTLKGKIYNGVKVHARKIMDNSEADWRCINMSNGTVKCRRIR